MDQSYDQFKITLQETCDWPSQYTFKFVVPIAKKGALLSLIPMGEISERQSSSGKYVSVSIRSRMETPEHVIEAYKKVSSLEGVITL